MFQAIFPVARHTPLNIIVTPNGERLSIIVIPKPSGDASDNPALSKPLSFVGTPEDLDREFPEQLRLYAESVNDLRTRLELPLSDLEAAKAKAAKKDAAKTDKESKKAAETKARSDAAKKAAETRAAKAEEKRKAKEATARKRAESRAARKADKTRINLPGTAAPAGKAVNEWPFPTGTHAAPKTGSKKTAKPNPDLPGKAECIADYKALVARYGRQLTRKGFIKQAPTKRRYEKLWANDWKAFVSEASNHALPLGEKPAAPPKTSEAPPATAAAPMTAQPATSANPPPASAGAESAVASDPATPPPPLVTWTMKDLKSGATLPWTLTSPPIEDEVIEVTHGVRVKVVDIDPKTHVAIVKSVLTAAVTA